MAAVVAVATCKTNEIQKSGKNKGNLCVRVCAAGTGVKLITHVYANLPSYRGIRNLIGWRGDTSRYINNASASKVEAAQ